MLLSVVILCGLGLVLLRHRIAAWLVPVPQPELGSSAAGVQAVAFSVVGVFLLAHGLAGFLAHLAMLVSEAWGSSVELLAAPIAEIAVGAAVFVGSRRLAAVWQSLRTAAVPSRDRDDGAV